ncbi:hypothetical protein B0G77_1714 [Paraburkholderia sp. BL10I2N1]|nr:hypothetical protein B0G77_1714 [Paraburkholderia sp. BL10I2N1]
MPRDGGIILASAIERTQLDAILASNPFARQKVAQYDVVEFKATPVGTWAQTVVAGVCLSRTLSARRAQVFDLPRLRVPGGVGYWVQTGLMLSRRKAFS